MQENLNMNRFEGFPGRVKRTNMIEELLLESWQGGEAIIAGRVIGILDGEGVMMGLPADFVGEKGFILKDESEKIIVLTNKLPKIGSIVEVKVVVEENRRGKMLEDWELLADCEDFYVSLKESPNYKKMVVDANLGEKLKMRSKVVKAIRDFFEQKGFLETETPCLVRLPGMEPYLDVFKTKFEANFDASGQISEDMYLITSPEYAMKKLLVGGLEKVFQITKSFRNKESFSERHNPEFTILEWYRAYASYLEIMDDTEELVKFLWEKFGERDESGVLKKIKYKGMEIDLMSPWKKLKVIDAFQEYAGITAEQFLDLEKFRKVVMSKGYKVDEQTSFEELFFVVFMNEIEPRLGLDKPVILYDYPVSMAALSKRCAEDVRFAERFEAYVGGLELCNAFTELNDPDEQFKRLSAEREERKALGKIDYQVDQTFIDALKFGMPPSGGNALGVDRLVMLLLGEEDIRNVLLFPHRDL